MNKTLKIAFSVVLLLIVFNTSAQKEDNQYAQYQKLINIDIQNDSLSNYIISLKDDLRIAEAGGNIFKIAENNLFLAIIYYQLHSLDIAIDYNLNALKSFKQTEDTVYIIRTLSSLIRIYTYTENYSIAINYARKALELSNSILDTIFIERSCLNIAVINMSLGETDTGIYYFEKALELGEKINDREALVVIYNNLGFYYYEKNSLYSARYYYTKSLNSFEDKEKSSYSAVVYANLANVDYKNKKYEDALLNAQIALEYLKNISIYSDIDEAYQILVKASIKTGKYTEAINYFEHYLNDRQADIARRKSEEAAIVKVLYETNELESQIELLNTENALKESKLFFASVIIILTILILVFIIIQNIKLKKSYKKIVDESVKSMKIENENIELKKKIPSKVLEEINIEIGIKDDKLFLEIIELVKDKELYKDPNLSLNKLSEMLNTNRSYISKSINRYSDKSFVEFINEYRIKEAKRLLCTKDAELLTIEAIGIKSGFNSSATFFRVFKSVTGVTPKFFLINA